VQNGRATCLVSSHVLHGIAYLNALRAGDKCWYIHDRATGNNMSRGTSRSSSSSGQTPLQSRTSTTSGHARDRAAGNNPNRGTSRSSSSSPVQPLQNGPSTASGYASDRAARNNRNRGTSRSTSSSAQPLQIRPMTTMTPVRTAMEDDEETQCAICFEVPQQWGLLGKLARLLFRVFTPC
jgi:hypothetical protein